MCGTYGGVEAPVECAVALKIATQGPECADALYEFATPCTAKFLVICVLLDNEDALVLVKKIVVYILAIRCAQ